MCPDCNEQLKITICAHMTSPGCLGKNSICQLRYNMKGISAAQSSVPCQSVFHEWIDRAVLIESPQTWTRPDSLEGSIFPINMHIMLLLRGFLQGFCTHFDWQKQWKVGIWAVRSFIINWTHFWSGRNHNQDQVFTTTVVSCSGPRPGHYIYISSSLLSG